jgi:hypothetical protein
MNSEDVATETSQPSSSPAPEEMKLEVVVLPVSDVDASRLAPS